MMDEKQVKTIVAEVLKHIDLHGRIKSGSIPCGVSNRHLHVSQADLETLFGKGYQLKQMKPLSQPGQYAAEETVLLVGPKGSIEKCRILGPVRPATQVEVSTTDCFKLVAARHMHISAVEADKFGLKDMDRISIKSTGVKSVIFNNVLVRVSDKFALDFHLDTDEANAAGIKNGDMVEIVA